MLEAFMLTSLSVASVMLGCAVTAIRLNRKIDALTDKLRQREHDNFELSYKYSDAQRNVENLQAEISRLNAENIEQTEERLQFIGVLQRTVDRLTNENVALARNQADLNDKVRDAITLLTDSSLPPLKVINVKKEQG